MDEYCDGCAVLEYSPALNAYDVYSAHCCDPDKPMTGKRRVVGVSRVGPPVYITRPVWCRGFRKAPNRG